MWNHSLGQERFSVKIKNPDRNKLVYHNAGTQRYVFHRSILYIIPLHVPQSNADLIKHNAKKLVQNVTFEGERGKAEISGDGHFK